MRTPFVRCRRETIEFHLAQQRTTQQQDEHCAGTHDRTVHEPERGRRQHLEEPAKPAADDAAREQGEVIRADHHRVHGERRGARHECERDRCNVEIRCCAHEMKQRWPDERSSACAARPFTDREQHAGERKECAAERDLHRGRRARCAAVTASARTRSRRARRPARRANRATGTTSPESSTPNNSRST